MADVHFAFRKPVHTMMHEIESMNTVRCHRAKLSPTGRQRALPCLLVFACLLSACGSGSEEAGKAGKSGAESDGAAAAAAVETSAQNINAQDRAGLQSGGEIRLSVGNFAENWNPMHIDGNNADYSNVRAALLPTFFHFDAQGVATPNPDYVVSVEEVSQDPTIVRFRLNPDAVWGDGSPVDGDDMKAKWQACNGEDKAFNCTSTQGYDAIANIDTGKDKTDVTITYKSTYPDWSQGFSIPGAIKAESINAVDVFNEGWKALNNDWLSGPFKLGSFDEAQQVMTLVPNERWWGEKPLLDKIIWRAIAPDAVAQAFANDEIDAFDIGSDPDAYQRATRVADGEVRKAGGPNFRHFTFNTKAGRLQELAVRQAIVLGLDRESIAASDLAGIDWPAIPLNNHVFLRSQQGFVDSAAATNLDYDPDKARALLDEAGWALGADGVREKEGQKLVVRFTQIATVKVSENEALQAQSQLADIGVQLKIVTIPTARFGKTLSGHEFELIAFSWVGTPYPFTGLKQLYGTGSQSNYAQLSLPAVDDLIAKIDAESDTAARIELANRASSLLWENVHTLPLYQRPELIASKQSLANYGAFGLGSPRWEDVGFQ